MNLLKYVFPLLLVIFLVGCGQSSETMTPEKIIEDATVVITANEQEILADATIWTITEKTQFRSHISKKFGAADVSPGDLISIKSDGSIAESYPMQGTATVVTLFNDDESLKISSAISAFMENQTEGDVLEFNILSIEENMLTAEMKLWNLEDDRKFKVEIDVETNDYSVTENNDS